MSWVTRGTTVPSIEKKVKERSRTVGTRTSLDLNVSGSDAIDFEAS